MSQDVLFVRNEDSGEDDDWNDDILISVYDRALEVAKVEVAQRIAMDTNTPIKSEFNESPSNVKENGVGKSKKKGNKPPKKHNWRLGNVCRAVFSEDGAEYEATIKRIINDELCRVSYIGYGNEETQRFTDLRPSQGKFAIAKQKYDALVEDNRGDAGQGEDDDETMESDKEPNNFLGMSSFKNMKMNLPSGFSLPMNIPPPSNKGFSGELPLPLPPLPFLSQSNGLSDDKALHHMLFSWYMSGYYTGLYQGQQMQKRSKK